MKHCSDIAADRAYGKETEGEFVELCSQSGRAAHPFQLDRSKSARIWVAGQIVISPDVAVWSGKHATLHEIKAKYPTRGGEIGLERYRLDEYRKLAPRVDVFYTIKLTARTEKGRDLIMEHCPEWAGDWVTAPFSRLFGAGRTGWGPSWIAGKRQGNVEMVYWPLRLWTPIRWRLAA